MSPPLAPLHCRRRRRARTDCVLSTGRPCDWRRAHPLRAWAHLRATHPPHPALPAHRPPRPGGGCSSPTPPARPCALRSTSPASAATTPAGAAARQRTHPRHLSPSHDVPTVRNEVPSERAHSRPTLPGPCRKLGEREADEAELLKDLEVLDDSALRAFIAARARASPISPPAPPATLPDRCSARGRSCSGGSASDERPAPCSCAGGRGESAGAGGGGGGGAGEGYSEPQGCAAGDGG